MPTLSVLSKMRIGTKLGISAGLGVVLVAAMIVNEQSGTSAVERQNAIAQRQQAVALEVANAERLLRRAQLAGRDLRAARKSDEINAIRTELQQIMVAGEERLAALEKDSQRAENRERFGKIRKLFKDYVAALTDLGNHQNEILELFTERDKVASKWSRGVNIVVNSPELAFTANGKDVEFDVYEAASAFKEARIAAWRYVALAEAGQIETITRSAEQTHEAAQLRPRPDHHPVGRSAGIDTLLAIVPEFTGVLTATTKAIDAQNHIQAERARPAETEIRGLLNQAMPLPRSAPRKRSWRRCDPDPAGRIGLGTGLVVVCILMGSAVFASLTIGGRSGRSAKC